MRVVSKEEFQQEFQDFAERIDKGAVFIYPTDTIYGIGCDATNPEAVQKVRDTKERYNQPFSIIAPSIQWIFENCVVSTEAEVWLEKLPGPYTLILPLKNKNVVPAVVNKGMDSIGVRMPRHWVTEFVEGFGRPIITTSANRVGENFMTRMENLDPKVKKKMDFIVFEGEKKGRPSTLVNLREEEITLQKR